MKFENDNKAAHKRAVFFDKLAKFSIHGGGLAVIIAVVAILVFILMEGLPLLYNASTEKHAKVDLEDNIVSSGLDEYQKYAWVLKKDDVLEFIDLERNKISKKDSLHELNKLKIVSVFKDISQSKIALGLSNGYVAALNLKFKISYDKSNQRIIEPGVEVKELIKVDSLNRDIVQISYSENEDGLVNYVYQVGNEVDMYSFQLETSLFGDEERTEYKFNINKLANESVIKEFKLDKTGELLVINSSRNKIAAISFREIENPELIAEKDLSGSGNISEFEIILGNQSVIVGFDDGKIESWMITKNDMPDELEFKFVNTHKFESLDDKVVSISASNRSKDFLAADKEGNIKLYFLTSERTLLDEQIAEDISEISFAPKANGLLVRFSDGKLLNYKIENPHPEISIKTLFGKVWYEGYSEPEYVWQSTGGDDSFESKFSLVPLIYGTMKGTLYAMFFAIPLAILGALYTSTFASPNIKNKVKPVVELMSALPSVVIGFLAGLWFAPVLEANFPGMILLFIIEPLMIVISVLLWKKIDYINKKLRNGYEIFIIMPLLLVGGVIAIEFGPLFEKIFFGGDYRIFLEHTLNVTYDQRNSIVVGFAMGFAVIPIIFTICEDALSSVPQHLTSASLALGANKWQTAVRVVLPTASPGIFSAIMIGFGRAIGETMIVLMATGNTPIMSMNPFNGMRTLSANIAVEIPEAPYHGTLYRVLFVSAALLFILTFVVNTVAEIVRQRLRKKYMHI